MNICFIFRQELCNMQFVAIFVGHMKHNFFKDDSTASPSVEMIILCRDVLS